MLLWSSPALRSVVGLFRWRTANRLRTPLRCTHQQRCLFTTTGGKLAREYDEGESSHRPPLREWSLKVSPFSTLRACLSCSISVRPLDPHAFPEADRAFVAVHGGDQGTDVEDFCVHYDDHGKELFISAERADSSLSVHLSVPIKSNLFIRTHAEGNVQVKNMECDICKVHTEKGDCSLRSVKGHLVEVRSGGDVTGEGTIHGNVDISAFGKGAVRVKKLQGSEMKVSTEHGPLAVKAVYAESSCVSSFTGKVELGLIHGDATVKNREGHTLIDGSNGLLMLSSESGDIDVYVGDGASSEVLSREGQVCVRVPSSLQAEVELCGVTVDVSHDVILHQVQENTTENQTRVTGYMNTDGPVRQRIKVTTERGSVSLRTQSWLQSLKLGR
ncbi:protein FAM185A [Hippocampus comes]|uniref:Family with sequence similarity 185 member A n=1 Tax=Hippocampus comes TaxID=109280 RepID=A0A3Q2XVS1_HIPCM|nr:PREDICTED: protein FAM185A [Hippocampus comes]